MRPDKLRILQVGMGGWGRDWATRVIPKLREVELVGCVDPNPASLALLRETLPIPAERCFSSVAEGLAATLPAAVLVTTLLPGHVPVARAALEAGKHVLVEKPFAPTVDEARELVELADERGLTLMVSQNYRFFPAVRAVSRLVREGRLGELDHVSIDFRHASPPMPIGPNPHLLYQQPLLEDMSIHHFDLLRLLVGTEPVRVFCETWNPPWSGFAGPPAAVASIVFEGGVIVSYRGSWISAGTSTRWGGEWQMEFRRSEVLWTSRGDEGSSADEVRVRPRGGEPKALVLPRMRRVDRWGTLAEFASAVREQREPESSGRENLGSLALTAAVVESATRHQVITLPLD